MVGDFDLFFDSKLYAQGGNLTLKKKPFAKLIELKETYDLCDTWRVRNSKSKRFFSTQILRISFKVDFTTNSFRILFSNLQLRQRY